MDYGLTSTVELDVLSGGVGWTGLNIYRKQDDGAWEQIDTNYQGVIPYIDELAPDELEDRVYHYRVAGVKGEMEGPTSQSVTVQLPRYGLDAIARSKADVDNGQFSSGVIAGWAAVPNADGYYVYNNNHPTDPLVTDELKIEFYTTGTPFLRVKPYRDFGGTRVFGPEVEVPITDFIPNQNASGFVCSHGIAVLQTEPYLLVNGDDDNFNAVPDFNEANADLDDDDLALLEFPLTDWLDPNYFRPKRLEFGSAIRVWEVGEGGVLLNLASGETTASNAWYIEGVQASSGVTISVYVDSNFDGEPDLYFDQITIPVVDVTTQTPTEAFSNLDDDDADGVADVYDGFNLNRSENSDHYFAADDLNEGEDDFQAFTVTLSEDLQGAVFYLDFDNYNVPGLWGPGATANAPLPTYNTIPWGGVLRVWTKDGSGARSSEQALVGEGDEGFLLLPNQGFTLDDLGVQGSAFTLFVEGIAPGTAEIVLGIDLDGHGPAPTRYLRSSDNFISVGTSAEIEPDLAVDSNNNGSLDEADDEVEDSVEIDGSPLPGLIVPLNDGDWDNDGLAAVIGGAVRSAVAPTVARTITRALAAEFAPEAVGAGVGAAIGYQRGGWDGAYKGAAVGATIVGGTRLGIASARWAGARMGHLASKGIQRVGTGGLRNEIPLTQAQQAEAKAIALEYGAIDEMIIFSENMNTGYANLWGKEVLYVGSDLLPAANAAQSGIIANSRLTMRAVLAHELYGHRRVVLAGRSRQVGGYFSEIANATEEAEASIRAARFAPGLSSTERYTLMRDAITRLRKQDLRVRDVRQQLWILEP